MITIPGPFAARIARDEGEPGRRWLAGLPRLVDDLCEDWALRPAGDPLHGYVAIVLPVTRADGTPAMLKITWRDAETADEPVALAIWNGAGAVLLLERDDVRGALLLERLESRRSLDDEPIEAAVTVAGGLLRRLAVPAPTLRRTLPELARRWIAELPEENAKLGNPVPKPLLDKAIGYCRELGPSAAAQLVNEDLHYFNVLGGIREPWLLIDPKVLSGDPEFGLVPLLWNRFGLMDGDSGVRDRLAALVEIAELDAERARGWTLVRAVDNWLWTRAHDGFPTAEACARIAAALAG
jgi:streptomycin 6-kinase